MRVKSWVGLIAILSVWAVIGIALYYFAARPAFLCGSNVQLCMQKYHRILVQSLSPFEAEVCSEAPFELEIDGEWYLSHEVSAPVFVERERVSCLDKVMLRNVSGALLRVKEGGDVWVRFVSPNRVQIRVVNMSEPRALLGDILSGLVVGALGSALLLCIFHGQILETRID